MERLGASLTTRESCEEQRRGQWKGVTRPG